MAFDTFRFFQFMLDAMPAGSIYTDFAPSAEVWKEEGISHARAAFARVGGERKWNEEHTAIISSRMEDELSPMALEWYEECARSVAMFSCYVLGGLLAKRALREIADAEFLLADALLPGFILEKMEAICRHLTPV